MPKVSEAHLEARRQQILDAARARFASHGFARTSMTDIVEASGLSIGAIYRYFTSKDEIVTAICGQTTQAMPNDLSSDSVHGFLDHIRAAERETGHARLVAQIYAEAAVSAPLAALVRAQLDELRVAVAALLPRSELGRTEEAAEVFVALCQGFAQQLAVRGDVDPAPYVRALMAIVDQ